MKEIFEENIGLLIHDVARLLRVLYDRQMASIGLTRSQWWLLTYLFFKDGINQSELAILMDMEKAPLSRLLDRMEIKGWVIRKNESKDRRTKNIYLSESVKPLISSMRDKAADYRSESLSILTNKDLNKLKDILQILKKDLNLKIDMVDLNKAMLLEGKKRIKNVNVKFFQQNAENLSFLDNIYDKYLISFCLPVSLSKYNKACFLVCLLGIVNVIGFFLPVK